MSILLKVKSENQSLINRFTKQLNKILKSLGHNICDKVPNFGIEVILEEIPYIQSSDRMKINLIALSVNYVIYYYLMDYLNKNLETNRDINEKMFEISHRLESNNKYSTGANGIYKHCVCHNMIIFESYDIKNICEALAEDFNDMVVIWISQIKSFHESMKEYVKQK